MKRKNSVGYFSAYYRGLECLLDMWPEIRKQVPDATLDIYYGWESWVAFNGEDELFERINGKLTKLKNEGVKEHGRVSHEELARCMKQIKVWAYPTEFHEIHCITALKAQEAGCYPVVTEVAALKETVCTGFVVDTENIYTDKEKQEEFIRCVVRVLTDDGKFEFKPSVKDRYWSDVAKRWSDFAKDKLGNKNNT